jgi:tetratricopeptide (TPR) repeat protein
LYFQDGSLIFPKAGIPKGQLDETLLSLFPFFDAEIAFWEHGRFLEESLEHKTSLLHLITEGVRQMPFHPLLKEFLEEKKSVPKGTANIHLLTGEERQLLDLLDGKKSGAELLAVHAGSPEGFWKTLFLLYCLNVVELPEAPVERAEGGGRRRVTPDLEARLQEAADFRKKLPRMDDYQVMNVSPNADEAEIKKAYFKLVRKFHPDLFGRDLDPEFKSQIDEVFDTITKAYRTLMSKGPKAPAALHQAGAARHIEKDRLKNAETRFLQGKTLFDRGRYEEAIGLLEEAVRLKENKGDYYLLLALAQSRIPDLSRKAEKNFLKAIELEPWDAEGFVGLGLLYKQEGLVHRARKQFEKALEVDPEHEAARRELSLLSEKPGEKKGLKGILTRDLFGSKKK